MSLHHARRTIARYPPLASASLSTKASETVEYLSETLLLTPPLLARTIRNAPHILTRGIGPFQSRLTFLDTVARIPFDKLPNAVAKCPHILWMDLSNAAEVIQTVVDSCPSITPTTLGTVFSRVPQALISKPSAIGANIDTIRKAGVTDPGCMARIFAKTPLSLVYDVENTLGKRLRYLRDELKFGEETVGKVLVSTPEVLEWSVDKALRPRVELLASLVGDDGVAEVVEKVPCLFGSEDILDRVLWLRDEVGLDDSQIRRVLRAAPAILTYSVLGNLAPKWAFVHETMGGQKEDLVEMPREVLCANLQQRAMPRYAFLASLGKTHMPVCEVLGGSDVEFCRRVGCDADVFRRYVDDDTYLLFFSRLM